jgi:hypothetical protein
LQHSHDGTPKHTQAIIDATQKEAAIDQQHSRENADMPMSSNHTEVSVHCCHGNSVEFANCIAIPRIPKKNYSSDSEC